MMDAEHYSTSQIERVLDLFHDEYYRRCPIKAKHWLVWRGEYTRIQDSVSDDYEALEPSFVGIPHRYSA